MRVEPFLILGIPLAFFLFAFVVGCFENRRVRMFESTPVASVPSYLNAMLQGALDLGCVQTDSGYHTKYKDKVVGFLLLAPDLRTLIVAAEGTIANIPYRETMLISRLPANSYQFTVDLSGAAELDPFTKRQILIKAGFRELFDRHCDRLREGLLPVDFPESADWSVLNEIYRTRIDRIVHAGLARYVDSEREVYRYTPLGSFRATIIHGLTQVLRPTNHLRNAK